MNSVGFPPLIDKKARVLILGSIPGKESLLRKQYYAHPRNYFWPLMHTLFGVGLTGTDYETRIRRLKAKGVAVWDVINCCYRPGSLDSDILPESVELNDFQSLLENYPDIKAIFFNGQKARDLFCKKVAPHLSNKLELYALPSTSPANASISFKDKTIQWSTIKKVLEVKES